MTAADPGPGRTTAGRTGRTVVLGVGALVLAGVVLGAIVALPRAGAAGGPGGSPAVGIVSSATDSRTVAAPSPCDAPQPSLGASLGACYAPSASTQGSSVSSPSSSGGYAPGSGSASAAAAASPVGSPTGSAAGSPVGSSPTPPSAAPIAAPTSARGFKVRATVVPMAFPLPSTAAYAYGDGWRAPRDGIVRTYNQIRGIAPDGSYLRAHDGIDILVKNGTRVLAPFSGTVVDPAKHWKPWDPGRYGNVVVIESDEATSPGYYVILAHLSRLAVAVGDHVERGQVVGRTGQTGNAAGTRPHLHLELRAPFLIRYGYAGVIRRLDVFDAEPSVRAAGPLGH